MPRVYANAYDGPTIKLDLSMPLRDPREEKAVKPMCDNHPKVWALHWLGGSRELLCCDCLSERQGRPCYHR